MTQQSLQDLLPESLKTGLTEAENSLLENVPKGILADLRSGNPATDNPINSPSWGARRTVRAEFFHWLCTDPAASRRIHPKGVRIAGAKFVGTLEFEGATLDHFLGIFACALPEGINLSHARTRGLYFSGSHTGAILAYHLETSGPMVLDSGFRANGTVYLNGAIIGGDLILNGATLSNPEGAALSADGIRINGAMFLKEGFKAAGTVSLVGADIGRNLACIGAHFCTPKGNALCADDLKINGSVFLMDGFIANGTVRLAGARIGGNLVCTGAHFSNIEGDAIMADGLKVGGTVFLSSCFRANGTVRIPSSEIGGNLNCSGATFSTTKMFAFVADSLKVAGSVFLNDGFIAKGEVRLLKADIGADLNCINARFINPGGKVLSADGVRIRGSVILKDCFHAYGEVRFLTAEIGGDLDCHGGKFRNPNGIALYADGARINGSVFLNMGFLSDGEIRFLRAQIVNDLDCIRATLNNPTGNALSADEMTVGGSVSLREEFAAYGTVRLIGAEIGGDLACENAIFSKVGGDTFVAERIQLKGGLIWRKLKARPDGVINLSHARVGKLNDDEESWPREGNLILEGFEYESFAGETPRSACERLRWLRLQPLQPGRFWSQPYEHLAKVLANMGHEADAREVLIAKQEDFCKFGNLDKAAKAWNRLLGVLIAHGYKPWKAFWPIFALVLIGGAIFWYADSLGVMQPSKERVYLDPQFMASQKPPDRYPEFQPLVYSIDVFFPFLDLHQESYWLPATAMLAGGTFLGCRAGYWFRLYLWFHIGIGWVLSAFAVAALTGLIRTDRHR